MGIVERVRGERGQGFVEFALIVPFILLLIGGMVQAGIVAKDYIELHSAVNAAARTALVCRITKISLDDTTQGALATFTNATKGVAGAVLTHSGDCPGSPSGPITFTGTADCILHFPLIGDVTCPSLTASVTENVE